jgi:hypothetical protein
LRQRAVRLADGQSDFVAMAIVPPNNDCFPATGVKAVTDSHLIRLIALCRCFADARDRRQSATGIAGAVPRHDTLLDLCDCASDEAQLIDEAVQRDPDLSRSTDQSRPLMRGSRRASITGRADTSHEAVKIVADVKTGASIGAVLLQPAFPEEAPSCSVSASIQSALTL